MSVTFNSDSETFTSHYQVQAVRMGVFQGCFFSPARSLPVGMLLDRMI